MITITPNKKIDKDKLARFIQELSTKLPDDYVTFNMNLKEGIRMSSFPTILIFLMLLGLILGSIAFGLRKGASGIKIMLLGLNLTLFGGIIAVDPSSNLSGIEYLIAFLGLIISIIGLGKKD